MCFRQIIFYKFWIHFRGWTVIILDNTWVSLRIYFVEYLSYIIQYFTHYSFQACFIYLKSIPVSVYISNKIQDVWGLTLKKQLSKRMSLHGASSDSGMIGYWGLRSICWQHLDRRVGGSMCQLLSLRSNNASRLLISFPAPKHLTVFMSNLKRNVLVI